MEASRDVDVGRTFFGKTGPREDHGGRGCGGIGQNVARNKVIESCKVLGLESGLFEKVFLEDQKGLDLA